jgi:NDP-sugar pyrophosphorylase family protein
MAGFGERFRRLGYTIPKPMISIFGKPLVVHILDMFPGEKDIYFICNKNHLDEPSYKMEKILHQYYPEGKIIGIEPHKKGPVYSVSRAFQHFSPDEPTIVSYCDFNCLWDWDRFKRYVLENNCDGAVICYKGFHPHMLNFNKFAYIRQVADRILAIKEKESYTGDPMSEYAVTGTYYFANGALMRKAFEKALGREDLSTNGEHYVSLAYIPLLEQNRDIRMFEAEYCMSWGRPEDLDDFMYHARIHRNLLNVTPPPLPIARENTVKIAGTTLIPMAGLGNRFLEAGYSISKPLIHVDNLPMFLRSKKDLPLTENSIFIIRSDMPQFDQIRIILQQKEPNCKIKILPQLTGGQAITCLDSMDMVDHEELIIIGACDNGFIWNNNKLNSLLENRSVDFLIWTQRNYPAGIRCPKMYSWVDANEQGVIKAVNVKKIPKNPHQDPLLTGTFLFRRAGDFIRAVKRMVDRNGRINNEFYIDECCNDALALGLKGVAFEVDAFISWGTPDELQTYEYWKAVYKRWMP